MTHRFWIVVLQGEPIVSAFRDDGITYYGVQAFSSFEDAERFVRQANQTRRECGETDDLQLLELEPASPAPAPTSEALPEPTCGQCRKFVPQNQQHGPNSHWGSCPMDKPKALRTSNVLVSRALDGYKGFEPCGEFDLRSYEPSDPAPRRERGGAEFVSLRALRSEPPLRAPWARGAATEFEPRSDEPPEPAVAVPPDARSAQFMRYPCGECRHFRQCSEVLGVCGNRESRYRLVTINSAHECFDAKPGAAQWKKE